VSSLIEEDIYQALESQTAVQKRDSLGGTGFAQIRQELERAKKQLEKE
jgi:argininosuccinate lyase